MTPDRNQRHRRPSLVRRQQMAPGYGQALELRNLLPSLTAKVTGTRPCKVCGAATASAKDAKCWRCKQ